MLTPQEIDDIVGRVVARLRPERVIVFGSYAKGTATRTSDLDLFVVKDTDLPMAHRGEQLAPVLATTLIPVDVHVYTPEEVTEYAKDEYSFVSSVLSTGRTAFSTETE
jgi:Predicted nucleotidyltransferases